MRSFLVTLWLFVAGAAALTGVLEAFHRLSDFSSDIAHELRTPVSNLMTETQVALLRQRSAEDYRRIPESNAEEFEHMARMISDIWRQSFLRCSTTTMQWPKKKGCSLL